jgi:hypothetical protein
MKKKTVKKKKARTYWFSAQLKFIALVEVRGGRMTDDSVFVFKSTNYKTAFQHALKIGKQNEHEYLNVNGERVIWKLKEIVTLDKMRAQSLDGIEVWSQLNILTKKEIIPFDAALKPKNSQPTQSF